MSIRYHFPSLTQSLTHFDVLCPLTMIFSGYLFLLLFLSLKNLFTPISFVQCFISLYEKKLLRSYLTWRIFCKKKVLLLLLYFYLILQMYCAPDSKKDPLTIIPYYSGNVLCPLQ